AAPRTSRARPGVPAAARPNATRGAVAVRPARAGPVASLPTLSASTQISAVLAKASSQSRGGASDRPDDGGAAARNAAIPPAASTQPSQSPARSGREYLAPTGSENSKPGATRGATGESGPNASARPCRP